jgi:hypothetical protein
MTEFHTAWSKLYKDFMRELGHEFPQSTLDEFEEEEHGGQSNSKCLFHGPGRLHGGAVLLCEENGRLKAFFNVFHPRCISGCKGNIKFLHGLLLKLKKDNPSVKAVMKAYGDELSAFAKNITTHATDYNGFTVRFLHIDHLERVKRELMELDDRVVEEALKGYEDSGGD